MDFRKILESKLPKKVVPDFRAGDTVKVSLKIVEGDKERIQAFEGVVIARENCGIRENFLVRRISYGVGVERKFFISSPTVEKIELVKKGMVKRAKLYYLRGKSRKEGRIKEKLEDQLVVKKIMPEAVKAKEAVIPEVKTKVVKEVKQKAKKETKKAKETK